MLPAKTGPRTATPAAPSLRVTVIGNTSGAMRAIPKLYYDPRSSAIDIPSQLNRVLNNKETRPGLIQVACHCASGVPVTPGTDAD